MAVLSYKNFWTVLAIATYEKITAHEALALFLDRKPSPDEIEDLEEMIYGAWEVWMLFKDRRRLL